MQRRIPRPFSRVPPVVRLPPYGVLVVVVMLGTGCRRGEPARDVARPDVDSNGEGLGSDDGTPGSARRAEGEGNDCATKTRTSAGVVAFEDVPSSGQEGPSAPYPAPSPDDRPSAAVTPPRLAAGWVAADAPRFYLPDDLHLLVNGGDGVFLRYGFAWAARRSYRAEREVSRMVRVEVYAFSSPDGARGRYDHDGRETGQVWSAEPPPPELAGKVDAARVDLDQARLLSGRHYALLQYEDPAETDLANLVEAASPMLLEFADALADVLGRGAEDGR